MLPKPCQFKPKPEVKLFPLIPLVTRIPQGSFPPIPKSFPRSGMSLRTTTGRPLTLVVKIRVALSQSAARLSRASATAVLNPPVVLYPKIPRPLRLSQKNPSHQSAQERRAPPMQTLLITSIIRVVDRRSIMMAHLMPAPPHVIDTESKLQWLRGQSRPSKRLKRISKLQKNHPATNPPPNTSMRSPGPGVSTNPSLSRISLRGVDKVAITALITPPKEDLKRLPADVKLLPAEPLSRRLNPSSCLGLRSASLLQNLHPLSRLEVALA